MNLQLELVKGLGKDHSGKRYLVKKKDWRHNKKGATGNATSSGDATGEGCGRENPSPCPIVVGHSVASGQSFMYVYLYKCRHRNIYRDRHTHRARYTCQTTVHRLHLHLAHSYAELHPSIHQSVSIYIHRPFCLVQVSFPFLCFFCLFMPELRNRN